jgi:AcrR family transcriptional regulator
MARPKEPLIDKAEAVAAALRIVDEEGLAKFSLRRLGQALGVNGMSLYHHFADKEAILQEVAALILSEIRPTRPVDDYAEWSLRAAVRYRKALLAHPNAIPLFVERYPGRSRSLMYQHEFHAFEEVGIDRRYWLIILETVESFIVGSVLYLRAGASRTSRLHEDFEPDRQVIEAVEAADTDYDGAFRRAYLGLIDSLLETYRQLSAAPTGSAPAVTR